MGKNFCVRIEFLDTVAAFHGRGDGNDPEWPPSPLRVFQAFVASAADRWRGPEFDDIARPALEILQRMSLQVVIAPQHLIGKPIRIAVPNNDLDVIAAAWSKGRVPKKQPSELKTLKTVRPVRLSLSNESAAVYYIYPCNGDLLPKRHREILVAAARSITHLGWGIDMVVANASVLTDEEVSNLPGERWLPVDDSSATGYRVPTSGTLDALIRKHRAFLERIGPDGFKPVPPLSAFRVVGYRRATDPPGRRFVAFSILKPDASGNRSFDTCRRTRDVAGMVRNLAARMAEPEWSVTDVNVFIHGKSADGSRPASGEKSPDRFAYLPLPTINPRRVDSIRRVLIAAPSQCDSQIAWARRMLSGQDLQGDDGNSKGLLTVLPGSDWVLQQYVRPAQTWSTVTPVILPGYDKGNSAKAELLLNRAFEQAGFHAKLIECSDIEFRKVGFRPGVDLASRYLPPKNLDNRPRYHVRVRFPDSVTGPIAVGSGRFRGFGLFANEV